MEKRFAEEQARQAEKQAQTLMEERAKIKAEKEQLERSHDEMAARLQLLEGIIGDSEVLEGDEDEILCEADVADFSDSTHQILSQRPEDQALE